MSRTRSAPQAQSGGRGAANPWAYVVPAVLLLGWQQGDRLKRGLQRSEAVWRTAIKQLGGIINRAPVGIVQAGLDGRIELANECYCRLIGHSPGHLRTLKLHELTHPEHRDEHLERHTELLESGQPFQIETRLIRADETDIWVVSHLHLTRDALGRPMHIIAAVQDISCRRASEAAMQGLAATIERRVAEAVAERVAAQESAWQAQRMEALSQLAGGVAHDFNNVLQAIAGGARLIQRRPDNAASVERLAGLVVDATERGAAITQRLSSFARRGPLQAAPIDVAALLTELHDIIAAMSGGDLKVELAITETLPQLLADRRQLELVLINLATNARDAMEGGHSMEKERKPANTLRLAAAVAAGRVVGLPRAPFIRIDVSDTGPGMGSDIMERATEPFFTTKPRSRGTGLGLAMAQGFAEQSGGKLLLQSEPGKGTTASLYLPQIAAPDGRTASGGVPGIGRRSQIVLVDDDPEVLEVLAEVLTACGYNVDNFDSALVALNHLSADAPADLLITDLSMPGTDGMALIREAQRRQPGLPAILLSGYSGEELGLSTDSLPGGRLALLQKPVRATELTKQVATLLARPTPTN